MARKATPHQTNPRRSSSSRTGQGQTSSRAPSGSGFEPNRSSARGFGGFGSNTSRPHAPRPHAPRPHAHRPPIHRPHPHRHHVRHTHSHPGTYSRRYRSSRGSCGLFLALLIFAVIALIVLAVEHNWLGNLFKQQTASVQPTQRIETVAVSDELSVHFLDVGQGDSTLIVSGEHAMLVDTADDSMGTRIQYDLQKRGITKLDYLVLTHPDSDHIGGAPVIITKFDIQNILVSPYIKDNRYYEKVTDALSYRAYLTQTPELGDTYWLGDASFTFIAPIQQYDDPNNSSLCLILTHGQNRFLFTGDAEREAERDILESGTDLQVDVYQVGHHGSDTSTTQDFLDAVAPTYAVISCEKDNPYGHPHEEILERLQNQQVEIYRTDLQGTITAHSNGEAITWTTEITETTETINQQNSIKTA